MLFDPYDIPAVGAVRPDVSCLCGERKYILLGAYSPSSPPL